MEGDLMISGYDTVLIAGGQVAAAAKGFLDDLHKRWPDMSVRVAGADDSDFLRWLDVRSILPSDIGEVMVAKNSTMEADWDERGYALTDDGEGPFMIFYRRLAKPSVRVLALEDPYAGNEGLGYEPYEITLVGGQISLVTVVTPDSDSPFSRTVIDGLAAKLAQGIEG